MLLEHRYYGVSQPFDTWETKNLRYLTVDNALADIAAFIDFMNNQTESRFGNNTRQWVVIGGSYPGALSAWFRYKYPHLAVGSIASSAVVRAVADYQAYDWQVFDSVARSGKKCVDVIHHYNEFVDKAFLNKNRSDAEEIKQIFGVERPINDGEFMYFFADIFAGQVQYGSRRSMCDTLMSFDFNCPWEYLRALANFTRSIGFTPAGYHMEDLQNTTIDFNKASRQWTYQTCTEVGYFQTPFHRRPFRSQLLKLDYWKQSCREAFGIDIFTHDH